MDINDYEARRAANIARNRALLKDLDIHRHSVATPSSERPSKRRKTISTQPSRASARIAGTTPTKLSYNESELAKAEYRLANSSSTKRGTRKPPRGIKRGVRSLSPINERLATPPPDIEKLQASWSVWEPTAGEPTRDSITKQFHFDTHPEFAPNKSPSEMLHEGVFGGTYFRPLRSRKLGIEVSNDWRELPSSWVHGLEVQRYLTSTEYDPEVNKYKVQCGQSIEEWEASGWINHDYDVRGWFQWYCRFYLGRRCDDDERQVRRWRNCVGTTGRWRLALLRKYLKLGVREVFDDGEEEQEVSPVVHQTCLHWAFEVRQDVLEAFWANPR